MRWLIGQLNQNRVSLPSPHTQDNKVRMEMLPDWLLDPELKNGDRDTLTMPETKFWNDMIDKYLKPLELSEADKKDVAAALINLRDMVIMAFIMINAIFVLVIFLLQINKEMLHIKWPVQAKNTIFYDGDTHEIRIDREYLQLEPLGILFVVFFGAVLAIQFISMLKHRFGTISEILATVTLDWYCNKRPDQMSVESDLTGNAVFIARNLQRPKKQWDEDELDEETKALHRRDTVHKLIHQRKNKQDWSNLESNFKRRFYSDNELDTGRITLRRDTMNYLNDRRISMREDRRIRKSMLMGFRPPPPANGQTLLLNNDGINESNVDDIFDMDKHNSTVIWAQHQSNSINYLSNRYPGEQEGGGGGGLGLGGSGGNVSGEAIMPAWNSNEYSMSPSPVVAHHLRRQKSPQQQQQQHLESDDDDDDEIEIVVGKQKSVADGGVDNPSFVYDNNAVFMGMGSPTLTTTSSGGGDAGPGESRRRKSEKVVTFDPDNFSD